MADTYRVPITIWPVNWNITMLQEPISDGLLDVRGELLDWRDSADTNRMPRGKQIELLSTLNKYKVELCAKEK